MSRSDSTPATYWLWKCRSLSTGSALRRSSNRRVAPRIGAIAEVRDVAATNFVPMTLSPTEISRFTTRFGVPGQPVTEEGYPLAQLRWTTPAYFRALSVPLLRDDCSLTRLSARPASDPRSAGTTIFSGSRSCGPAPDAKRWRTEAGSRHNPRSSRQRARLGLGCRAAARDLQLGISNRVALLIRTPVSAAALIQPVRSVLRDINPDRALRNLAPLENLIARSLARRRFGLELLDIFGALAAILTTVVVYGVVIYALSHRLHEFAIRRALGADGGQLAVLVLKRFALLTLAGLAAGAMFAGALKTQLYKLPASDPVTLIGAGSGLLMLIAGAALKPAIAAASVSPNSIPRG